VADRIADDFDREMELEFGKGLPHFMGFIVLVVTSFIDVWFDRMIVTTHLIDWASDGIAINDKEKLLLLKTGLLGKRWLSDKTVSLLKEEEIRLKEQIVIKKLAGI